MIVQENIINNPPKNWVSLLKPGNLVWLVKEKRPVPVVKEFDVDTKLATIGDIVIHNNFREEKWYIRSDGGGIDHKLLMLPIDGHFEYTKEDLMIKEIIL